MDTGILESIGLTRNESIVYLTLIKRGMSKTGEILKDSHLNSGKIYEILESLKLKGLVSESIINNVKHFSAAPPKEIIEYIKAKKEALKDEERVIQQALPDLENLRNSSLAELRAVTYLGLRGIKTAADEALSSMKSNEEILAMGVTQMKNSKFNEFWRSLAQKRVNKKIIAKHIFSEKSHYFEAFKKMKYTQARILTLVTPSAVDVFGKNKVLIFNYNEPASCILIYDKNVATSFTNFFYSLWKIAKA